MAKLTRSRLAEIREVLDQSLFTSAAFEIETSDKEAVVRVKYRDHVEFYATLFYAQKRRTTLEEITLGFGDASTVLCQQFCPGNYMEIERDDEVSFEKFKAGLVGWTNRLRSEIILVGGFETQFTEFQKQLNKRLEAAFVNPEERFTEDEVEEVKGKLREFESKIEELRKANQVTESHVAELREIVSDLTKATQGLPKRAWYRTACSKIYSLSWKFLNSRAGQKVIDATLDRLLGPPKNG